jgi:tetratricopeptide (TPR) repeat protein
MCGITLNWLGEPERALKMIEKAISLDARSPPTWEWNMGQSHLILRQYEEAEAKFLKTIERAPKFTYAYMLLACVYAELNRLSDAHEAIKTAMELMPKFSIKEFTRIWPYRIDDDRNRMLDSLRKAGLPEG